METSSISSITKYKTKNLGKRKLISNKFTNLITLDGSYNYNNNNMDITLVPFVNDEDETLSQQQITSIRGNNENATYNDNNDNQNKVNNIEKLFPSPGVIIKDIYEIFKANKPVRKRDSVVLNFLKLLF